MLIVDSDLVAKIDANRGDMSRGEFLRFLLYSALGSVRPCAQNQYLRREEFEKFTQEMRELLRRFLDFFVTYRIPADGESKNLSFEELTQKLQSLTSGAARQKGSR
jgi:hypothetical protein